MNDRTALKVYHKICIDIDNLLVEHNLSKLYSIGCISNDSPCNIQPYIYFNGKTKKVILKFWMNLTSIQHVPLNKWQDAADILLAYFKKFNNTRIEIDKVMQAYIIKMSIQDYENLLTTYKLKGVL